MSGTRRAAVASVLFVAVGLIVTLLAVVNDQSSPGPDDDALKHATQRLAVRDADPGPRPFPLGLIVLGIGGTIVAGALPWGVLGLARLLRRGPSRDDDDL